MCYFSVQIISFVSYLKCVLPFFYRLILPLSFFLSFVFRFILHSVRCPYVLNKSLHLLGPPFNWHTHISNAQPFLSLSLSLSLFPLYPSPILTAIQINCQSLFLICHFLWFARCVTKLRFSSIYFSFKFIFCLFVSFQVLLTVNAYNLGKK